MFRVLLPLLLVLAACGGERSAEPGQSASPSQSRSSEVETASPTPTSAPSPSATRTPRPGTTESADPRWRFYSSDRSRHTSPWFAGAHRVMIGYGCTVAPYYDHDPRCAGRQGFHHGIDVAMPCGTPLTSDVNGVVLSPTEPGSPGPAYGVNPLRIHTGDVDVLIGHTRRVFVEPGDRLRAGQRIALASDSGAPDGCHLHFEVRRHGQGLDGAIDPARLLKLS
jgi:murein DD-endopeptidase MepM/ murein hydrolase activator NlpD